MRDTEFRSDDCNVDVSQSNQENLLASPTSLEVTLRLLKMTLPFAALFVTATVFWGRISNWMGVASLLLMYSVTGLGVTVGFHRLFTHKSFETYRPIKIMLAIFGSMAAEDPLIRWVAVHRRHHQLSDRPGDPHSPHHHDHEHGLMSMIRGLTYAHVGWFYGAQYTKLRRYAPDLLRDTDLVAIDRFFFLWVFLGLVIPGVICGILSRSFEAACIGILWGGFVRLALVHHITWSINSVCHTWGRRSFQTNDQSTNNFACAIVSFGEGWHNNHHAFPTSARHGLLWWEVDATWWLIFLTSKIGLVWGVRVPDAQSIRSKRLNTAQLGKN